MLYVLELVSADKRVLSGASIVDTYNAQHGKSSLRDGKVHGSNDCYRTLRVFDQQVSIGVSKPYHASRMERFAKIFNG